MKEDSESPCDCESKCEENQRSGGSCVGWTWIPSGVFGQSTDMCTLRRSWGGMTDNCGGKCFSGEVISINIHIFYVSVFKQVVD